MESTKCSKCKVEKKVSEFYVDQGVRCKECLKEARRDRYKKDPSMDLQYIRDNRIAIKKKRNAPETKQRLKDKLAEVKGQWILDNPKEYRDKQYKKMIKSLEWQKDNPLKHKIITRDNAKNAREKQRLPFYIVYCLPNYNKKGCYAYAGVTNLPGSRMRLHRFNDNNIEGWYVMDICNTKAEALAKEREYHGKGFGGSVWSNRQSELIKNK